VEFHVSLTLITGLVISQSPDELRFQSLTNANRHSHDPVLLQNEENAVCSSQFGCRFDVQSSTLPKTPCATN